MKNLFKYFDKLKSKFILFLIAISPVIFAQETNSQLKVDHLGNEQTILHTKQNARYILLPIEEGARESQFSIIVNNSIIKTIKVHLSINKVDYYVPIDLSSYNYNQVSFCSQGVPESATCWHEIKLSDTFNTTNREYFRPIYHFTPLYGWMNDPNGMVYKSGVYHLFYQYNPYGAIWGNMHWGHATSHDLINWTHHAVAIEPDTLGTIFSGSCIVDKYNTAGFGAEAIIAFYTAASEHQVQCMAYSLDNGETFKKYDHNPILTSTQQDFRDPKVFWHENTGRWIMILAVGQEVQFYSSQNLKNWTYESSFGKGQGAHNGVWECPDLIELSIEGTQVKKWVLISNINPGGPFGGSATQYFVGDFNGKKFVNNSPSTTKWMDWGKDHYATVTWNNAPQKRHIALAWMSNWEYANNVPTLQYRSADSTPRELSLYASKGEIYLRSAPCKELLKLRENETRKQAFKVDRTYNLDKLFMHNNGAYEIDMTIRNKDAGIIGFLLFNSKGEEVEIYYDLVEKKFAMDRTKSGNVSFSKDFPATTYAPIDNDYEMKLRLFIDKSSIEAFGNNGRFVMTNLIFPSEPYNRISFYAKGGSYNVTSFTLYQLGIK